MKTYSATDLHRRNLQISGTEKLVPGLAASIREIIALLGAVTVATSIVLMSVWMASSEINNMYSAGTWAIGLVFLGVALDKRGSLAYVQTATGLIFLILAFLQNSVSVNFSIISGVLLAAWVAIALFVHLRQHDTYL